MLPACVVLGFLGVVVLGEILTPILPGDPYNVIGDIEKRRLGRCSYLYAWLAIPAGSHQDIYAHYSACSRLELRFMEAARETRSARPDYTVNVGEELNRVNKDFTAQLADLETLDALLQAVKITNDAQTSPPLTTKDRIFYLSDRLGQYTMMAMLRPGRLPKIEVVPPPSEKTYIHPQNVLCYRKLCESVQEPVVSTQASFATNMTTEYIKLLAQSKQENRHLYVQLIIFRVVFTVATFLGILFGITSLILCLRLRATTTLPRKRQLVDSAYHNTPSSHQLNGGYKLSGHLLYADPSGCPVNATNLHSDTASLHNTVMSSNISNSEIRMPSGTNGSVYPAYAYPVANSAERSAFFTTGPVGASGGQLYYQLPATGLNRSVSPASEGYRTGSLDRRSEAASEKMQRRTPIQVISLPQGADVPPTANFIPFPRPFSQYQQSSFKPAGSLSNDQTMVSQNSVGTVIHNYPGDMSCHDSMNG